MELAAEMPAKVLSDLLGISIESASTGRRKPATSPGYMAEAARRCG